MHNTDTSIQDSDEEDAVGSHVLDLAPSPLHSKRPEMFITSDYDVSVFRDIEAEVDEASDIVCNGGLDIGDMIVEHDETNDEEQRVEKESWKITGNGKQLMWSRRVDDNTNTQRKITQ